MEKTIPYVVNLTVYWPILAHYWFVVNIHSENIKEVVVVIFLKLLSIL